MEAQETLEAIRRADVDALVVTGPKGEQVFSLTGAEHIYRVIVETMNEAALTVDPDGTILFCNRRFCDLMRTPIQQVMGHKISLFAARPQQPSLKTLLADAQTGPVQRHLTLWTADGAAVPVQISAGLLQTGDTAMICLVASDLTELEEKANSIRVLREHQQALEESEARFRAVFESSQDAVLVADDAGVCVQANPAVQALFGLPAEQLLGQRLADFTGNVIQFQATWRVFLATGSFHEEIPLTAANGRARYVDAYGVANMLPSRHLWVIRDITERKRAEEALRETNTQLQAQKEQLEIQSEELQTQSEELRAQTDDLMAANAALTESEDRFRTLADNMSQLAWMADKNGWIFWYNQRWYQYTGTVLQDMQGWGWQQVVHPDHVQRVKDKMGDCFQHGTVWEDTFPLRGKDGNYRWFLSRATPIRDEQGCVLRWFGTNTDVTEQRQAAERMRELAGTLETKVAQRTAELEYRARQLQGLALDLSEAEDRERRRLAEILHDDLQQILAAAKFHLDLLGSRVKHEPAQQAIVSEVEHLLLDAIQRSRSLSHELSPAVLYHGSLVEILNWLAGQIRIKHGLEVTVEASGEARMASDALRTFLYKAAQELLFNVVKHARTNQARIRVRRLGRCLYLSVSDRGRGFDPQEVRRTAGFGLLSIRERIELLGGRMKIHSAKGRGSKFHLVVPDTMEEDKSMRTGEAQMLSSSRLPALSPPAPGGGRRVRVLLADDHAIVREGLISLLSEAGDIEIVGEAANGREAVDLAYRLQPDVVLMDVAMPLIDGNDATRQIKKHLPRTRVIALSMYEEPDMVEKMRRAGAEGYLLKTASSDKLLAALRGKAHPEATA
jgi:PAS domain S-box-containing protein